MFTHAQSLLHDRGFTPMMTPLLAREKVFFGTGYLPFFAEEVYQVQGADLALIGTSEQTLIGYYGDQILDADDLAIPTARKPAALASYLLDQATAGGVKDGGQGWAQERTSEPCQPEGRESSPVVQEEIVAWADQLDPSSNIDRVGALGVAGSSGAAIDTRLVTRFDGFSDHAAHGSAEDIAAEELAGDRERSAAGHQGSVDDPTTPRREDLDGQALAGRDLHDAAAARATAAENHGAPHAAVARASVTTTPPGAAATPRPTHLSGPTPHQPLPQSQRGPRLGR